MKKLLSLLLLASLNSTGQVKISTMPTTTNTNGYIPIVVGGVNYKILGTNLAASGVNAGQAQTLTYYPSTGTTVDDATGLTWDNTDKTLTITNATNTATAVIDGNGGAAIGFSQLGVGKLSIGYEDFSFHNVINSATQELWIQSTHTDGIAIDANLHYHPQASTDANIATVTNSFLQLGTITANRTLTLPGISTPEGRILYISVVNAAAFTWTTTANYRNFDGTLTNALPNGEFIVLMTDGWQWFRINGGPKTYTPTGSTDAKYPNGTIAADDNFIYFRTSTGTWKKVALGAF